MKLSYGVSLVALTALDADVVDEAFLAKQFAYFFVVLAAGRSLPAILAALYLFVDFGVIEEVGIVGIGVLLSVHYRYRC